jgi:hypothetical protein
VRVDLLPARVCFFPTGRTALLHSTAPHALFFRAPLCMPETLLQALLPHSVGSTPPNCISNLCLFSWCFVYWPKAPLGIFLLCSSPPPTPDEHIYQRPGSLSLALPPKPAPIFWACSSTLYSEACLCVGELWQQKGRHGCLYLPVVCKIS